jgi:hypothetical protein
VSDDVLWAVSVCAVRDAPDGSLDVIHTAAVFRGPTQEWVEQQGVHFAQNEFPVDDDWELHSARAVPVLPFVRDGVKYADDGHG